MKSVIEKLKRKKKEIIKKSRKKEIFIKKEILNERTIYHTKMLMDLYKFEINRYKENKFSILFRELFNQEKFEGFNLFSTKENDKFLGIFYGYRKPIKNIITKYKVNGTVKSYTFSKIYYIEFKFKKGSVFCYLRSLARLIKKEKINKKYFQAFIDMLNRLEKKVYEFYCKELPNGGIINKWIEKTLK
ncbi:DUF226 domain-containing protein (plasmid) [Borreliella californiensis]|uniref:Borrelia family protein n=1 Tax=Borreliella californiensis TaxID=373543 RepID=A0A7W9ZLI0_9SPIR|nr:DUF226 domain-containing protein [Borreliella californiensis]MBB6213715.1 hypothetical protein [Borreliella californiensis]